MKTEELLPFKGKKASLVIKNRWGEGSIIRAGTVTGVSSAIAIEIERGHTISFLVEDVLSCVEL